MIILVIPETDRHRWHRLRNDHLANFVFQGFSVFIEGVRVNAQVNALDFPGIDRWAGYAADKAGANIRSSATGQQPQIVFHIFIKPGHAFGRYRRASKHDGLQPRQVVTVSRNNSGLLLHLYECRTCTEQRRITLLDQAPECFTIRIIRVAIIQNRNHTKQHRTHEEIPHHPAERRIKELPISRFKIHVQR